MKTEDNNVQENHVRGALFSLLSSCQSGELNGSKSSTKGSKLRNGKRKMKAEKKEKKSNFSIFLCM